MPKAKTAPAEPAVTVPVVDLANALATAIESARPSKKHQHNRTKNTPWSPKNGEPKVKLKRKFFQHGIDVNEKRHTSAEIDLMNKVKPGTYCDGYVKVVRRRDKGIDIDYPIKTASQRLKLISEYGIRSLTELLQRCIDEGNAPKRPDATDED